MINKIKILVIDVDGTLTDGKIYIGSQGELMKAFHVKDGYAIAHMLPEMGVVPVIITGRTSEIVRCRAGELKIKELHQGVNKKIDVLEKVMQKYGVSYQNVAYMGDDLNDLECIEACEVSGCPADAVDEVRTKVQYVCKNSGGNSAVREFIEWLKKRYQ